MDMIKKFEEFIGEGVWGNISKRSEGTQERKEDDVNSMDLETFANYINSRYECKDSIVLTCSDDEYSKDHYDWLLVPFYNMRNTSEVQQVLVLNDTGSEKFITIDDFFIFGNQAILATPPNDIKKDFSVSICKREFRDPQDKGVKMWPEYIRKCHKPGEIVRDDMVEPYIPISTDYECAIIDPKDGSKCTNRFFLIVLDYIINILSNSKLDRDRVLIKKK